MVIIHMLRHIFILSSAGYFCGWLMVKFDFATLPLVAGTLLAIVLVSLYLLLSLVVWLLPAADNTQRYRDREEDPGRGSLLGYDGRGRLRIHTGERRR